MSDEEIIATARDADPSIVVERATFHGVIPLLARRLRRAVNSGLDELQHSLDQRAGGIARRNLLLTAALVEIAKGFKNEAIPLLAMKGPVLANDLYGDVALRPFLDVDILVSRRDVERAEQCLVASGYQPGPLGGRSIRWRQQQGQRPFYRADGAQVDLHWRVLPGYFTAGAALDENSMRNEVTLGGISIPTLPPDVLLLHLSLHGTKHTWDRLKWIGDVARFVRKYHAFDWDNLLHKARASGMERMTLVGVWAARELLGSGMPSAAARRIGQDNAVAMLGREVCARLFERHAPEGFWPPWHFNIRVRERVRDKVRCGVGLVHALGVTDVPAAVNRMLTGPPTSPKG